MVDGKKVNTIEFVIDNYDSADEMWKDIATVARILLHNGEIITLEQEDEWVYILKHDSTDDEIADVLPFWLTPEEYEEMQTAFENSKCNCVDNCVDNCVAPEEELKGGYEYD